MTRVMQALFGVAAALVLAGPATAVQAATATSAPDQAFMRLADRYLDTYYFPTNPTTATAGTSPMMRS